MAGFNLSFSFERGEITRLFVNRIEHLSSQRAVGDLTEVCRTYDEVAQDKVAYLMFRGVRAVDHGRLFEKHGLRYDVTVVRPGFIGLEYMKTHGHYHNSPWLGEMYQVLMGDAVFLLQSVERNFVHSVVAITAKSGDAIFIPPGFGHATINTGATDLVMANLVSNRCEQDYEGYEKARGAACFVIQGGTSSRLISQAFSNLPVFVGHIAGPSGAKAYMNTRHLNVKRVVAKMASDMDILKKFSMHECMYSAFVDKPEAFELLLSEPE